MFYHKIFQKLLATVTGMMFVSVCIWAFQGSDLIASLGPKHLELDCCLSAVTGVRAWALTRLVRSLCIYWLMCGLISSAANMRLWTHAWCIVTSNQNTFPSHKLYCAIPNLQSENSIWLYITDCCAASISLYCHLLSYPRKGELQAQVLDQKSLMVNQSFYQLLLLKVRGVERKKASK